jgi:hypothetical protein
MNLDASATLSAQPVQWRSVLRHLAHRNRRYMLKYTNEARHSRDPFAITPYALINSITASANASGSSCGRL